MFHSVDQEDRFAGGRHTYKINVAMKSNGDCKWLNPAVFKSICKVDVTYFPFDDQECFMKFGSWSFDISKLDLYAHDKYMVNRFLVENGEWRLTLVELKRNTIKYQCCPHSFVDVTVRIRIQRQSLDFVLKMIIPCCLISSMIFLGFVLPPESGERIGLSITVLLAMTVFQQLSSELMPSYGFPLLGQYYFATMIEIGASLLVTTLILNFYHRNNRRMPKPLRLLILRWLARLVFPTQKPKDCNIAKFNVEASNANRKNFNYDSQSETESLYYFDSIMENYEQKGSRQYSDPWVPLQRQNELGNACGKKGMVSIKNGRTIVTGRGGKYAYKQTAESNKTTQRKMTRPNQCHRRQTSTKSCSPPASLVSFDVFCNTSSTELSRQKLKNQKEWIKAARVLDRLFLILSVIIGVVTLLALFFKAPRFRP